MHDITRRAVKWTVTTSDMNPNHDSCATTKVKWTSQHNKGREESKSTETVKVAELLRGKKDKVGSWPQHVPQQTSSHLDQIGCVEILLYHLLSL